jgi:hypothetical protein
VPEILTSNSAEKVRPSKGVLDDEFDLNYFEREVQLTILLEKN